LQNLISKIDDKVVCKVVQIWYSICTLLIGAIMNKSKSAAQIFSREEINHFLTIGIERCGKDCKKVRKELLNICDHESNPIKQWNKIRALLLDNIVSQISNLKSRSNLKRQESPKRAGRKPQVYKPEQWVILIDILNKYSYLYNCIKIVAVLNAYEDPQKLLPKGVSLINPEELPYDYFPPYYLRHNKIRFYLSLKSGETTSFDIDKNEYNNLCALRSVLEFKNQEGKQSQSIKDKEFYEFLKKEFSGTTYINKISPLNKPSKNLSIFDQLHRRAIIRDYVGTYIEKYEWTLESFPVLDKNAVYELIFKSQGIRRNDLDGDYFMYKYPTWEPDILHLNPKLMSYQLADDFLKTLSEPERGMCLIQSSRVLGFRLFNIKSFREIANHWQLFPHGRQQKALANSISNHYTDSRMKLNETQKKYWSIYLNVKRLKRLGFKKKEAYEKLQHKYYMSSNTLCTRYKEKAVEAKKSKLVDEEIVINYGLYEFNEVLPRIPLLKY